MSDDQVPLCNGTRRDTRGLLVYVTRGSTYLVDYHAGTVTRYPGTGTEAVQPPRLPTDYQELRFTSVTVDVDEPLVFTVIQEGSPIELVTSALREVGVFPELWLPEVAS